MLLATVTLVAVPTVVSAQADSSISGTVLTQGANPVEGASVELLTGGVSEATVITGVDGTFSFDGLDAAIYELVQVAPGLGSLIVDQTDQLATVGTAGGTASLNTGDQVTAIDLAEGVDATGYIFYDEAVARIAGVAFDDLNRNDVRDVGEPDLDTATIAVSDGGPLNDQTVTTGPDGAFEVILTAGNTYSLEPTEFTTHRPGLLADPQPAGTVNGGLVEGLTLAELEEITTFQFGFQLIDVVLPSAPVIAVPDMDGVIAPNPRSFSGTTADDLALAEVQVQIEDTATGFFLQSDGITFDVVGHSEPGAVDPVGGTSATWSYTAPDLPDGDYRLGVVSVDTEGNLSGQTNRLFTVGIPDNTDPLVEITAPIDGAILNDALVITGTASDETDLALVELGIQNLDSGAYWDGSAWVASPARVEPFGLENWNFELQVVPGEYQITAFATDTSTNETATSIVVNRFFPIDWSRDPGVAGEIDDFIPATKLDVTDFGAIADDGLNDKAAFVAAIQQAGLMGGAEILVPAGQFDVHANIKVLQDNTVISGAGPDLTTINFTTKSGIGFEFGGSFPYASPGVDPAESSATTTTVVSGALGSRTMVIADPTDFVVGRLALLTTNLNTPRPSGRAGQTVKIIAVETVGGVAEITVEDPLTDDFTDFYISPFDAVTGSGIQSLTISNAPGNRVTDLVLFRGTENGFYRNVESRDALQSHVATRYSYHCEVRDSFFDDAIEHGDGGRGYGIDIANRTSGCLIENNTFQFLRHSILFQDGAAGNVAAFNYASNPRHPNFTTGGPADISFHSYSVANLVEGNVVGRIHMNDAGVPGQYNTLLRNCLVDGPLTLQGNTANEAFIGNATYGTDAALQAIVMPPVLDSNPTLDTPRPFLLPGQTVFDTDGVLELDPSADLTLHQNWRDGTRHGTAVFGTDIPTSLYGSTQPTILSAPTGDPLVDCQIAAGGPNTDVQVRLVSPSRSTENVLNPLTITGEVITSAGATEAQIQLQNLDSDEWLQADGQTFGATEATVTVATDSADLTATFGLSLPELAFADYELELVGTDLIGSPFATTTFYFSITPDTVAPVAVIDSPVSLEELSNRVSISGSVVDDVGAGSVRLYLRRTESGEWLQPDGLSFGGFAGPVVVPTLTGDPIGLFDYELLVDLEPGSYYLVARGIDAAGNFEPGNSFDTVVFYAEDLDEDTVAPVAVIDSPVSLEELSNRVSISGSVVDDVGAGSVRLYLRRTESGEWLQPDGLSFGGFAGPVVVPTLTGDPIGLFDYELLVDLEPGSYYLVARGIDAAGNFEPGNSFDTVVFYAEDLDEDTVAPVAVIDSPVSLEELSNRVSISGSVVDDVGAGSVRLYLRRTESGEWLQPDGLSFGGFAGPVVVPTLTGDPIGLFDYELLVDLEPGSYYLVARGIDAAGNFEPGNSFDTVVFYAEDLDEDTVAPVAVIDSPVSLEELSNRVSISGSVVDDVGAGSVRLYLRRTESGEWLQPDGLSFGGFAGPVVVPTLTGDPIGLFDYELLVDLEPGSYYLVARGIDAAGNFEPGNSFDTVVFYAVE